MVTPAGAGEPPRFPVRAGVAYHHEIRPRLSARPEHPPFMALSTCPHCVYTEAARPREKVEARLGGERSPGNAPASPTGPKAAEGSFPERLDPEVPPHR